MRLSGVIVLFHPNLEALYRNILSVVDQVDHLFLYKNSTVDEVTILKSFDIQVQEKISFLGDGVNLGIAGALNIAAKLSIAENYTHLLTLDQDSYFRNDHLKSYKELIEASLKPDIGIFCCNIANRGEVVFSEDQSSILVPDSITSGTIFPIQTFLDAGYFDETLFIDAVDYEYCYRVKAMLGLNTLVFTNVILEHEVGYPEKIYGGFTTDNYSPLRTYYIVRNHIIIWRKYPKFFQKSYKKVLLEGHILKRFIKVIIGEKDKIKKLKSILLGLIHGLLNKTGKYEG